MPRFIVWSVVLLSLLNTNRFFSFNSTSFNFLTRRIEGLSGGSLPSILSELAVLDLLLMFGKPRPGNEDGGFGDQFRLVS